MKLNLRSETLVAKRDGCADVFIPTLYWPSAAAFLDDWGKPLADLAPTDASRHADELRHRLQTGLRAIVRHSSVMCGLPASEAGSESLVGILDSILAAVSAGQWLPAAFYTPVWHLREWLRGRARPENKQLPAPSMTDEQWDDYVRRIGGGE
jgi:hypothetical protein